MKKTSWYRGLQKFKPERGGGKTAGVKKKHPKDLFLGEGGERERERPSIPRKVSLPARYEPQSGGTHRKMGILWQHFGMKPTVYVLNLNLSRVNRGEDNYKSLFLCVSVCVCVFNSIEQNLKKKTPNVRPEDPWSDSDMKGFLCPSQSLQLSLFPFVFLQISQKKQNHTQACLGAVRSSSDIFLMINFIQSLSTSWLSCFPVSLKWKIYFHMAVVNNTVFCSSVIQY